MIPRSEYVGPVTKSAEAMFVRAERQAQRLDPEARARQAAARPISPIREALNGLGLTMTTLRRWEEAGLVAFERRRGRRIVDAAAVEHMRMVAQLRRAGFSIKAIAWMSETVPPGLPAMRSALQERLDHAEAARAGTVARARAAGPIARGRPGPSSGVRDASLAR